MSGIGGDPETGKKTVGGEHEVELSLRHIQPPTCPHHTVFCHTLVYTPASLNEEEGVKRKYVWVELTLSEKQKGYIINRK